MSQRHTWSFVALVLVAMSCDLNPSRIGSDFFDSGRLDISVMDSSSVILSTIKFDSLITGNASRVLIGSHLDSKLGRITASAYFQPTLSGNNTELVKSTSIFEKVVLHIKYDNYSFYDTTKQLILKAYQLNKNIKLRSDSRLYNTSDISTTGTSIGSASFIPRPHSKDSIELTLDQSFGDNFYNGFKNRTSEFTTDEKFVSHFKGFLIAPDSTTSSAMVGFSSEMQVRIYYIDRSEIPNRRRYISFTANKPYTATQIIANRIGTKLTSFASSRSKINAKLTEDISFIQAGSGLGMRIDMPHLRSLKQNPNFYPVNATLDIYPSREALGHNVELPSTLTLSVVDKFNRVLGKYTSQATLMKDNELERDTHYEVDVTNFANKQMNRIDLNEDALIITLPSENFGITADRVYFASRTLQYPTRLKITYANILNK
jgi:hypothetical protein